MRIALLLLFLWMTCLVADDLTFDPPSFWGADCCRPPCLLPEAPNDLFTIDLNAPTYEAGELSTDCGGIVRCGELFVQAKKIRYTHLKQLFCSGDLLVAYKEQVMVGESFFFDFTENKGFLSSVNTAYYPWQMGAAKVTFCADGSFLFEDGFLTTSEGQQHELALLAQEMRIDCEKRLTTTPLKVALFDRPILVLPGLTLDLSRLRRPPVEFKVGWGGYLGPHVSLRYHALSYRDFKASLRLDGYLDHGLGIGIESSLAPSCEPLAFYTRNYWAHDLAIDDPIKRNRYRFQGSYINRHFGERTHVRALYDYVSDPQMAADYNHESFNLNPAQETSFLLHHQENSFLTNLFVNVRLNSFQSVDQQLPSFEWQIHPIALPYSSCIFENTLRCSNVNFVPSNQLVNQTRQQALRLEIRPALYWPLHSSSFTLTPRVGLIAIGYSNSPEHHSQNQILGQASVEAQSALSRPFPWGGGHTLLPHARFTHFTTPTSGLDQHFIFTIEDGYVHFDELRFGIKNLFHFPNLCQPLTIDLWANSFFDPLNGIATLPKSYLDLDWQFHPSLFYHMGLGIHYGQDQLDFLNSRIEWGLSENAACHLEYRYRGAYAWRKANFYNFILDTARDQEALLASTLSDKRHTFLATLFYRINPDWNVRISSRYGWHAKDRRSYFEYELESRAMILDHWWLHFSYQHRESDSRYAFSLKLNR